MLKRGLILMASAVIALAQAPAQVRDSSLGAGSAGYSPITAGQRFKWVVQATVGPTNLAAGVVVSGWQTWSNEPREYGPHWEGFGKRYGLRLSTTATGSTMEATLGSLWGEDPRYFRASAGQSFKSRLGHVAKMTFVATNRNGNAMPAYARYISVPGNSVLSNAWRPNSQTQVSDTVARIPFSFLTRFIGSSFSEFWPDLRQRILKK
jgi:hypothetical protein